MRKLININIIGLALALALVAIYLLKYDSPVLTGAPSAQNTNNTEDTPYSYLQGVSMTQFDNNGQARHRLNAVELKQYASDNRLTLSQPVITLQQGDTVIAEAHAQSGLSYDEGQQIELIDNVVVKDLEHRASVKTTHVVINTVLRQVLTDQLVRVETPRSTTSAKGLHLDLPNERWRLISEVESVVRP